MKRLWRVFLWVFVGLLVLVALAQLIRPARTNLVLDPSQSFESFVRMEPPVTAILDRSCNDCHSNKTRWPWYSNVAPVSWFVIDHVNHARSHLNFSEWSKYDESERRDKLAGICKLVKEGEMPLASYTLMHRGAKLSGEDVSTLCAWVEKHRR
jgi:hypothetical protein